MPICIGLDTPTLKKSEDMKKTLYLVWNLGMSECVGFLDEADALYTATGDRNFLADPIASPTIGDQFRDTYVEDDEILPMTKTKVKFNV